MALSTFLKLAVLATVVYANVPTSSSPTSTALISPGSFSINIMPAVTAAPSCVANCLSPLSVGQGAKCPNGGQDPTNDCACMSAPIEAQIYIASCVSSVCTDSQSDLAATATSLYASYCAGHYLPTQLASASSIDALVLSSMSSAEAASLSSMLAAQSHTSTTTSRSSTGAAATAGSDGMLLALGGAIAAVIAL